MYMPYLMDGYAFALVLLLLGVQVALRTVPGLRGVRLLGWAMLFGLASVLLLGLRGHVPAWASILLANELLFVASLLIYCSVASMLGVPKRMLRPGIGICVTGAVAMSWFTWPHPALTPRILISSGICSLFAAATSWILFRHTDVLPDLIAPGKAMRSLPRALGGLQAALVLLDISRCALTLLYTPASFVHLDLVQAAFTYLNMLLYAATTGGLIWLALCLQRMDLQVMANTDGLTGLLNRRAFEDILIRQMKRQEIAGGVLSVMMLDIDRFKQVNDSLGHHAGDEVIRRVAAVLHESTRPEDALARYGGEEFVILLRERSLQQTADIAERLRTHIEKTDVLPGGVGVTVSIGVAERRQADTAVELLMRCDQALYESKRRGRNVVTVEGNLLGPGQISPQPV